MSTRPRLVNGGGPGLPLRVAESLWGGPVETLLDAVDSYVYRTAMNHSDGSGTGVHNGTHTGEATLFAFLDVADRLYGQIAEALARVGLSYAKFEVLEYLRNAEGPVNLSTLAEGQKCARSNITQLVDRLEKEGLVEREQDPDDRRGVRAVLTAAGAELSREGITQIDVVRARFAAAFTAAERAELARLLARVP